MQAVERQRQIVELVRAEGFASIEALARHYAVTPQTIRRDINLLCDRGLLRRHHGGAGIPPLPPEGVNIAYQARQVLNLEEKQRIGAVVAARIPDGASLFFGIGTTPEQVARALLKHRNLTVMTNNLNVASVLCANDSFTVSIAGGVLRNLDRDVTGDQAVAFFNTYKVDYGIFGVGGIDEDGTLLDFDSNEVRARQALVANSRQAFLVADHTKFGRNAVVRGGHFSQAVAFFTDRPVPAPFAAMVRRTGVPVYVAPGPHPAEGGAP